MNKKTKNIILIVLTILVIIATIFIARKKGVEVSFEKDAVQTSDIALPDLETMQFNSDFIVEAMSAIIYNQDTKEAKLNFTSPITNNCNIKCEVYASYEVVSNNPVAALVNFCKQDTNFVLIGSSDLIKPGQTLQYVKLDRVPDRQSHIIIKYVAYQPESLLSSGSFAQNTELFIVNNNGEMIDSNGNVQKVEITN